LREERQAKKRRPFSKAVGKKKKLFLRGPNKRVKVQYTRDGASEKNKKMEERRNRANTVKTWQKDWLLSKENKKYERRIGCTAGVAVEKKTGITTQETLLRGKEKKHKLHRK